MELSPLQEQEVTITGGGTQHKTNGEQQIDNVDEQHDAIDEHREQRDLYISKKFKKDERKKNRLETRRKKLEEEKRRKKPEERRKKMKRVISPSATLSSQRVRSPSVRSPGVNMPMSSLGVLAGAAVSKRGRSPSVMSGSPPSEERADSHVRSPSPVVSLSTPRKRNYTIIFPSPTRSPYVSRSPSPTASPLDGSRPTCSRGCKIRKLISTVWKDFKPIYRDRKLVEAQCKHCDEIIAAGRHVGTSSVRRHLANCKSRSDLHQIVEKLKASAPSHASILKEWDFDQQTSRKLLARMIVLHEMPFSIVEYHGFREFVKSLNPLFKMVSRVTIKNDCMELHKDQRSVLCEFFQRFDGRVSLTADRWKSNQTLGYSCITCHFIDNRWNLQKTIIRFCMLETPHDTVTMFNIVLKSIQDLNIEDKLFSMTLDNASVNGSMINSLRENLISKSMLHCNGDLLHVRCASHVFNLIVQDGLRVMKEEIDNIRDNVKYIKSSQSRMDKFKEIIAQVGISCGKMPKLGFRRGFYSLVLQLQTREAKYLLDN